MQMLHFRVPTSCNGMRLNIFLRTMGVSSACIKAVKYQGTGFCVRLGDEVIPVHTDYRVATAQIVSFALPPEPPTAVQPEPLPIDVIYEDEFAAVLNNPAGIAVHPTLNHTSGTLANGWLYRLKCRGEDGVFRPVNRIDKNTSGLVLCAQNAFAAPELAKTAQKCYLALVEGPLPVGSGRIDVPIPRRFHHWPLCKGRRQAQRDGIHRAGRQRFPCIGFLFSGNGPYPSDPRSLFLARPPAGGG